MLALLVAVSARPAEAGTGWRQDPGRTGAVATGLRPDPVKLWQRDFGGANGVVASHPIVSGDRTFFPVGYSTDPRDGQNHATKIVALHSRTGAMLWERWIDETAVYLAADGARLYALTFWGTLWALDPSTGSTVWVSIVGAGHVGRAVVADGRVIAYGTVSRRVDGTLHQGPGAVAFDAATGQELWFRLLPDMGPHGIEPTVDGGRVFVSEGCGNTYALSASTGAVLWHHTEDCAGNGNRLVAYRGRVYVQAFNDTQVLDGASGKVLGRLSGQMPLFLGDARFVNVWDELQNSAIEARTLSDDRLLWRHQQTYPDMVYWLGVVSPTYSYFRFNQTDLVVLNTATGAEAARITVSDDWSDRPVGYMHTDGRTLAVQMGTSVAGVDVAPASSNRARSGYWMLRSDGAVYPFGDASGHGAPAGINAANLTATRTGRGYWIVSRTGAVYAYGDARFLGGSPALAAGEEVTTIAALPAGDGYWLFTNRGRAIPYGEAGHFGDMAHTRLNGPVVASAATATGQGYLMVAADGGVFAFGDAGFLGSMGGKPLNRPVVGAATDPDGRGYWLIASDGGMFAFEAPFRGSMGGKPLNKPVVGGVPFADGYVMTASDGGVFNFSSAPFAGSLGSSPPPLPIVAISAFAA